MAAPDDSTKWEIGSITKAFTATLLATAAAGDSQSVSLDDKVWPYIEQYFPNGLPTENEPLQSTVTLEELGNFSSGLNRDNITGGYPFTVAQMFQNLATTPVFYSPPGTHYRYSNLGFAILAEAQAAIYGAADYRELLSQMILDPLGMADTDLYSDELASSIPNGYSYNSRTGEFVRATPYNGSWPAYDGAGGLVTTGPDFMSFLKFNLGLVPDVEINAALPALHTVSLDKDGHRVTLAWEAEGTTGFTKNGGVPRFHSQIFIDPSKENGVFISGNTAYNDLLITSDLLKRLISLS